MNRALIGCALVVIGCNQGRKLQDVEKDLAAAKLEEDALALEVKKAAEELARAESGESTARDQLTRATRTLAGIQPGVVRKWGGNPKKLAELKKSHPMPPGLAAALEAAQASGKDATPEKRFETFLTSSKLGELAALIDGWEAAEFSYEETEEATECAVEAPKIACRPDPRRGVLLCDDAANTWVIWAEAGTLYTRSAPLVGNEVVERPAPGVWVLRAGGDRHLYSTSEGSLLNWVVALPIERMGKKSKLTWKNLDDDPYPEGIFELGGDVRLLDVRSNHGVVAHSEAESCRQLSALDSLPEAAKKGCRARETVSADAGR